MKTEEAAKPPVKILQIVRVKIRSGRARSGDFDAAGKELLAKYGFFHFKEEPANRYLLADVPSDKIILFEYEDRNGKISGHPFKVVSIDFSRFDDSKTVRELEMDDGHTTYVPIQAEPDGFKVVEAIGHRINDWTIYCREPSEQLKERLLLAGKRDVLQTEPEDK